MLTDHPRGTTYSTLPAPDEPGRVHVPLYTKSSCVATRDERPASPYPSRSDSLIVAPSSGSCSSVDQLGKSLGFSTTERSSSVSRETSSGCWIRWYVPTVSVQLVV